MRTGLMQDYPLTVQPLIERMGSLYADKAVTTLRNGKFERRTYGQLVRRVHKLSDALRTLGVQRGDCVASLLWNCTEHLELYLAVPAMGAVLHTVNCRLPADAIAAMLAESEPRVLVADESLLPVLRRKVIPGSTSAVVVVGAASMNDPGEIGTTRSPVIGYESLLAKGSRQAAWPELDEREACGLCYTSGTSGKAKGVVYSHRSTVLHAMAMLFVDGIGLTEKDVCLPVVPMFHAQGWGFPYGACLCGADLALCYRLSDPATLASLIERTGATVATAVPTVWIAMLEALRSDDLDAARLASLRKLPIGGAAVSSDLIEGYAAFGIEVQHCWGMTETSPLGLVSTRRSTLTDTAWAALRCTPGVPQIGCEVRIMTDKGTQAPLDGKTVGELQIRGPWVADAYLDRTAPAGRGGQAGFETDSHGRRWLKTGDIALSNALGYVSIVDRAKDLIKSGGEWISSLALESALADHPAIREAAVVPVTDPVWQERPIAYLSLVDSWAGDEPDFAGFLEARFPRWQVPDRFIVLRELPKGPTGKVDKARLRELSKPS